MIESTNGEKMNMLEINKFFPVNLIVISAKRRIIKAYANILILLKKNFFFVFIKSKEAIKAINGKKKAKQFFYLKLEKLLS